MFGSWVLDVAIGLIVVFILFATICATLREGLEAWLKTRAAFLERGIRELLNDPQGNGLSRQFYEHPLVYPLFSGIYTPGSNGKPPSLRDRGGNLPSYIPSQNFALALMDIAARGPVFRTGQNGATTALTPIGVAPALLTLSTLRASVGTIQNEPVARALVSAIDAAQGDLEQARRNIEQWFDSAMDRVSGWYRRKTNLIVFLIGLTLAAAFNVDSFAIANHLYRNQADRDAIVKMAQDMPNPKATTTSLQRSELLSQEAPFMLAQAPGSTDGGFAAPAAAKPGAISPQRFNESLSLPIGWTTPGDYASWRVVSLMVAGWLMTAFAATLGAPFWFDVLGKIMIVRSTVKSYEKSPEKGSQERPAAPAPAATAPQAVPWATAQGPFERRQVSQIPHDGAVDIDGCGQSGAPDVEDKDLPAAQGGVR